MISLPIKTLFCHSISVPENTENIVLNVYSCFIFCLYNSYLLYILLLFYSIVNKSDEVTVLFLPFITKYIFTIF